MHVFFDLLRQSTNFLNDRYRHLSDCRIL